MTLVGLAHLFVSLTRRRLQHQVPELTRDRTVRLLEAALEEPKLNIGLVVASDLWGSGLLALGTSGAHVPDRSAGPSNFKSRVPHPRSWDIGPSHARLRRR
jgi:hypothetical protein